MPSAGGIRAGKAYVELYGEDSGLVRTLDANGKRLQSWGKGLASIGQRTALVGAAMAAPLVGAVNAWQEMGSAIDDISQRTGASVESLSTLGYAAKQSGTDMETLEGSLKKMEKNLAEAYRGNKEAEASFQRLGLTFDDLKGKSPDDQFRMIGDRLSRIKDPALRSATAMDIFGKSGTALLPMFADGAAGLEEMEQAARDLGLELNGDDAAAAAAFGDQLDTLWDVLKRGVFAIGSALGPALSDLVDQVTYYSSQAAKWIDANQGIVTSGAQLVAIVVASGAAMVATGVAMQALGGIVLKGISTFKTIAVGVSYLKSGLLFLMNPIGLVIAGIGLATAAFLYFSGYGSKLVQYLQDRFAEMGAFFGEAWGGIVAAVAKGDLGKAAEIAWLTVQVAFYSATADISAAWSKFCKGFLDVWDTVTFNLARLFADPWNTIQNWWVTGTTAMLDAWDVVMTGVMNSFASAKGFLAKGIAGLLNLLSGESITLGFDEIDKQTQAEQAKNTAARDQSIAARGAESAKQLEDLDARRNDKAKAMDEALEAKRLQRAEDLQKSLSGSKDRLSALNEKWNQAIEEAKTAIDPKTGRPPTAAKLPNIDGLQEVQKVMTSGTFNAAAVRGLGGIGGGPLERIAKATEETAKNTRKTPPPPSPPSRVDRMRGPKFLPGEG